MRLCRHVEGFDFHSESYGKPHKVLNLHFNRSILDTTMRIDLKGASAERGHCNHPDERG